MDDVEEIKKLKARYFRALDTKDWELYRSGFTEDLVFAYLGTGDVIESLDAFMDYRAA